MEAFMAAFKQPPKQLPNSSSQTDKKSRKERIHQNLPWIEKYRPKTINDIAHQEEVVAVLRKTISTFDFPNFLFYGPPGTGKTSTILAAARELFGHEMYADRVLELNASDERGIQVVRTKIKKFSQFVAPGTRPDGTPCPAFKIIILDEADSMTPPAQAALRRTMEKESRSTRFCLICNYISRIIDPITSRCAKFRFKPLDEKVAIGRVLSIAKEENVNIEEKVVRTLVEECEGDLRQAITLLQSCALLVQPLSESKGGKKRPSISTATTAASEDGGEAVITEEVVEEVIGHVPASLLGEITRAIEENAFNSLQKSVKVCLLAAHPASQVLQQFFEWVLQWTAINDRKRGAILEHISIVDERLTDGADEYLQLMSLFCFAAQILHSK